MVVKSSSPQGVTGKLFIKKTYPVKYALGLTILTRHFKMKNALDYNGVQFCLHLCI